THVRVSHRQLLILKHPQLTVGGVFLCVKKRKNRNEKKSHKRIQSGKGRKKLYGIIILASHLFKWM
ncbi:hypothetical protein, partial [Acinetobacter bereziniae]|uniref:hypothetical protein n=1 Tax=Acinetobacter bereziniae TaxID=106648 RepID=UPI001C2EB98C